MAVSGRFFYSEDCTEVGIADKNLQALNVFPNPVKDILSIENPNELNIQQVKVYEHGGKLVYQAKDPFNTLDLSSLPSGVFFVKIETAKGGVTRKIFKE